MSLPFRNNPEETKRAPEHDRNLVLMLKQVREEESLLLDQEATLVSVGDSLRVKVLDQIQASKQLVSGLELEVPELKRKFESGKDELQLTLGHLNEEESLLLDQEATLVSVGDSLRVKVLDQIQASKQLVSGLELEVPELKRKFESGREGLLLTLGRLSEEEGGLLDQEATLVSVGDSLRVKVLDQIQASKQLVSGLELEVPELKRKFESGKDELQLTLGHLNEEEGGLLDQEATLVSVGDSLRVKVLDQIQASKQLVSGLELEVPELKRKFESGREGLLLTLGRLSEEEGGLLDQEATLVSVGDSLRVKVLDQIQASKQLVSGLELEVPELKRKFESGKDELQLTLGHLNEEEGGLLDQEATLVSVGDSLRVKVLDQIQASKQLVSGLELEVPELKRKFESGREGLLLTLGRLSEEEGGLLDQEATLVSVGDSLRVKVLDQIQASKQLVSGLELEVPELKRKFESGREGLLLTLGRLSEEEGGLLDQEATLVSVGDSLRVKVLDQIQASKQLVSGLELEVPELKRKFESGKDELQLTLGHLNEEESLLLDQEATLVSVGDSLRVKVLDQIQASKQLVSGLELEVPELKRKFESGREGLLLTLGRLSEEEGGLLDQEATLVSVGDSLRVKVLDQIQASKQLVSGLELEVPELKRKFESGKDELQLTLGHLNEEESLLLDQEATLVSVGDSLRVKVLDQIQASKQLVSGLELEVPELKRKFESGKDELQLTLGHLNEEESLLLDQEATLVSVGDSLRVKVLDQIQASKQLVSGLELEVPELKRKFESGREGLLLTLGRLSEEEGGLLDQEATLVSVGDSLRVKVLDQIQASKQLVSGLELEVPELKRKFESGKDELQLTLGHLNEEEGGLLDQEATLVSVGDSLRVKVLDQIQASKQLVSGLELEVPELKRKFESGREGLLLTLGRLSEEEGGLLDQEATLVSVGDSLRVKVLDQIQASKQLVSGLELEVPELKRKFESGKDELQLTLGHLNEEEGGLLDQEATLVSVGDSLRVKVLDQIQASKQLVSGLELEVPELKRKFESGREGLLLTLGRLSEEEGGLLDQEATLVSVGDSLRVKVLDQIQASKQLVSGLELEVPELKRKFESGREGLLLTLGRLSEEEGGLSREESSLVNVERILRVKAKAQVTVNARKIAGLELEVPELKRKFESGREGLLLTLGRLSEEEGALSREKSSLLEEERRLRLKIEEALEAKTRNVANLNLDIREMREGENSDEDLVSLFGQLGEQERILREERSRLIAEGRRVLSRIEKGKEPTT